MASLIRKTLRDDRRALLGWMVGLAAFVSLYVGFYRQYRDAGMASVRTESMPKGMRDFLGIQDLLSPTGYLEATVYALTGPLLLIICAVVLGNRGVAGPEDGGVLDLLLANPIGRRRFILERFAALAIGIVTVAAVPWIMVLALASLMDMSVSVANISAASLSLMLLAMCFGSLAFTVGAVSGHRGTVLAVTGAVAVGTFLLRSFGGVIDALRPLRWLSPFHYYLGADPLRHGFHLGYLLALVGFVAVGLAVSVVAFERRDVGV